MQRRLSPRQYLAYQDYKNLTKEEVHRAPKKHYYDSDYYEWGYANPVETLVFQTRLYQEFWPESRELIGLINKGEFIHHKYECDMDNCECRLNLRRKVLRFGARENNEKVTRRSDRLLYWY